MIPDELWVAMASLILVFVGIIAVCAVAVLLVNLHAVGCTP